MVKQSRRRQHNRGNKRQNGQKGGYGAGAGPVGQAWTGGEPETWPGVAVANGTRDGSDGVMSSNHLPLSPHGIAVGGADIAVPEVSMFGGARKSRKRSKTNKHMKKSHKKAHKKSRKSYKKTHKTKRRVHRMKGGFGAQELLNFGHNVKYQIAGMYDSFMGAQQPVNPSPLADQPINQLPARVIAGTPINIARSINKADI
jgi:hypothetical protein